jgi:hypothetical protein
MGLELSQLHKLITGVNDPIEVGILPDRVMPIIGWKLPHVYLSKASCLHILQKHKDISLFDMLHIPFALERGMLVHQVHRDRTVAACYNDPETGKGYVAVLKPAEQSYEIWVCTYHRLKSKQEQQLRKHGLILKERD